MILYENYSFRYEIYNFLVLALLRYSKNIIKFQWHISHVW